MTLYTADSRDLEAAKTIYFERCDTVSTLAERFTEEEVWDLMVRAIVADAQHLTLSRAHAVLKQLEHRGFIAMVPRCARSITITARA